VGVSDLSCERTRQNRDPKKEKGGSYRSIPMTRVTYLFGVETRRNQGSNDDQSNNGLDHGRGSVRHLDYLCSLSSLESDTNEGFKKCSEQVRDIMPFSA
jgi:hypothetical protein